jgi:hypothetical protein
MRALFFALQILLLPALAAAQDPPECSRAREGMTACFGETLCLCRYDQGGQLTGRPSANRWDCGALRPGCGTVPADLNPSQTQLPPGLLLNLPNTAQGQTPAPSLLAPRRAY